MWLNVGNLVISFVSIHSSVLNIFLEYQFFQLHLEKDFKLCQFRKKERT